MSTGFVFEELYLWHNAGSITYGRQWVEQGEVWENPDTKRRFHSLLAASGYLAHLTPIPARHATEEEILVFHTRPYLERIRAQSALEGGNAGDMAQFSKGSYEIATLSAGGVLSAVEAVMEERVKNSYCLVRPPGHHAVADQGMGFCIFNNIVIAAHRARALGCPKIAIIGISMMHSCEGFRLFVVVFSLRL